MAERLFWIYLVLINGATFIAFLIDKLAARQSRWRIPEANLLFLALIGGSLGAMIAQHWIRHKTRKQPFRGILIAIVFAHVVGAVAYFAYVTAPAAHAAQPAQS